MVREESTPRPTVEQALREWVLEDYGPPSTANPNFREICAALVCTPVLCVDPHLSLAVLTRHRRVPARTGLRCPTALVGRSPGPGEEVGPTEGPPTSAVRTPGDGLRTSKAAAHGELLPL